MSAPDRIWAIPLDEDISDLRNAWIVMHPEDGTIEYLRRDGETVTALVEALREAAEIAHNTFRRRWKQ